MEKFLSRQTESINTAFVGVLQLPVSKPQPDQSLSEKRITPAQQLLNKQKPAKRVTHERHFQRVKKLFEEGTPILRIARQLKMSRNTVKKFLKYESPPRQSCRQRYSPIHRFVPYLRRRWMQDERNARRLWEEIKKQGYPGAQQTLCLFYKTGVITPAARFKPQRHGKRLKDAPPSVKSVKWLLFGSKRKAKDWENSFLEQLIQNNPEIAVAQTLTKEFHQTLMSRQDQTQTLETWLEKARSSGIGEFIWFANGIRPLAKES